MTRLVHGEQTILHAVVQHLAMSKSRNQIPTYGVVELMKERDCTSAFHGYRNFPGYICISMNEEVVHGIGNDSRIIQYGDIVKIDVGIVKDGWVGDNALTVPVGEVDSEVRRLLEVTEESLYLAIEHARDGERLGDPRAPKLRAF